MSCISCTKPFSLLRKERGCPGCGFSYCSKCLDNKIFLPKLNAEAKVCAKCKNSSSKSTEAKGIVAPDAYYRRIGAMDPSQPGNSNSNAGTQDQLILERLKKLKEDRKNQPPSTTDEDIKSRLQNIKGETPSASDAEIYSRLAKLKGMPVEVVTAKPVLPPPDTRTEQEQADDLIRQYLEQTTIDTKYTDEFNGLISDIEARMQNLKGTNPGSQQPQPSTTTEEPSESDDEEAAVKKIIEKMKAEASFEADVVPPSGTTSDELPFCEICNEDARMRCLGCQYLFCKRCFLDHKDDDDGCNRYVPYEAPKAQ